ncbi:hypothetical protein CPB85DRAFT_157604 [Mucidula mucida]|nr:hypothetical protein CPB85DRAFT_157604 [Mucidula mucida]
MLKAPDTWNVALFTLSVDRKTQSVPQARCIRSFLYIAAFGAILLNISATMTSLVLIERLSGLQWNAAKRHWAANNGFVVNFDGVSLLSDFGVHKLWRYLIWHWLISLIAGMWCMLFEIIMFVWVSQKTTNAAKIAMTCFMVFTALPLIIIQSLPIRTLLKAAGVVAVTFRTSAIGADSESAFPG